MISEGIFFSDEEERGLEKYLESVESTVLHSGELV